MKRKHLSLMAILSSVICMLALISCSSHDPKEITPTSTEFTSGELAKYIEVVDEPSELTFAENDDDYISSQYIRLKVKLKLIKENPDLASVDARDINFSGLMSVALITLVDDNDTKVQELEIKSEDLLKLKKLLKASEGTVEEIIFEGEYHNSEDSPKWFENSKRFTPYLTADIKIKSNKKNEVSVEPVEKEASNTGLEVLLPSALKGKVEVVNCSKVTKNEHGFPEVDITFKLLQKVNTASLVSQYGQLWIVGVGQDSNGRDVKELLPSYGEWRTHDSDGSEFKAFLEDEPGETINMSFTGSNDGDVDEGIGKVAKFKLKISK